MKVKFDSKQFGKVLFIVYLFLLIPLIGMLVMTFNDLDQLVMNPGFTESEKLRSDFPKLIFVIGFIFMIGICSSISLLFYIRRNKHTLDFEEISLEDQGLPISNTIEQQKEIESDEKLTLLKQLEKNNVLKKEPLDLNELLTQSCKSLNAGLGALYLSNSQSDTDYLEFSYGYAIHKPSNSRKILIGEGLTGQAAASKQSILIKSISDNHIKIYSGLGASSPRSLLITPIIFEDKTVGVIEIASFNEFNTSTQAELEEVARYISNKIPA